MEEGMPVSFGDRSGNCPNRQGHLVLGHCALPEVPLPESCSATSADCAYGVLHCRCLKTRGLYVGTSDPVTPTTRNMPRIHVKTRCRI